MVGRPGRGLPDCGVPAIEFTSISPIVPVRDLEIALTRYRRLGFDSRAYQGPERYGFVDRGSVSIHLTEWADHNPLRTVAYGLREFAYIDPDGTAHRVGSPLSR